MELRTPVLVREHPEGVLATPVAFPDLVTVGESVAAVLAELEPGLRDRVSSLHPSLLTDMAAWGDPELETVTISVQPRGRKESDPSVVRITLVVVPHEGSEGRAYLVRAPEVPQLDLTIVERERVGEAALPALAKLLRRWYIGSVLASDEIGAVSLHQVSVVVRRDDASDGSGGRERQPTVLEEYGTDLAAIAEALPLVRLDRRDDLVARVLAALAGNVRSSVVLVGPRDAGKTALVHELAARLASGDVPASLAGRRLWRLTANELIAGAQYTGMWQQRVRSLLQAARGEGAIVAMGDPAALLDAGRWSQSDNNVGRALRPFIDSGELTIICECTPEGFAAARRLEAGVMDAFQRIDVDEPDDATCAGILTDAAGRLERAHEVSIAADARAAAIELTRRFEPYRAFPGKAVQALEEAVQERVSGERSDGPLDREQVIASFARRTGLPIALLSDEQPLPPATVRAFLEERILGQPAAVEAMVNLVMVLKAALGDPRKPLGSFLFVGPTGVGKTELARSLAELLFGSRDRLLRFDLGEYASGDAVPRLVGSAWQRKEEGELTRRVREQPFCVVLLDEVEKAHRDVFDTLLSALGEGRLTDAAGRTADFRNAIIVMTSNLGASSRSGQVLGFASPDDEDAQRRAVEEAERFFRPEFVNRIDRVVAFGALTRDDVRRIARREVGRLLMREGVTRRQLLVEIDDEVVDALAERGFHPRYGARPLQREIERAVIAPLARLVVERGPGPGDLLRFSVRSGEIVLDLRPLTSEPQPLAPPAQGERRHAALGRLRKEAEALLERAEGVERSPEAEGLRAETSELLVRTHQPGFWDDPDEARQTLARIYAIERVLERLASLSGRAGGLAELARQLQLHGDRRRAGELAAALAEVEDALAVVQVEVAGAGAAGSGRRATVRVTPVGPDSGGWAERLLAMYEAWAQRTGREVVRRDGLAPTLTLQDPASYELLAAEHGLHRLLRRGQPALLARVSVLDPDADAGPPPPDEDAIVRVYSEGRHRYVRDPRSDVRVGDVDAVLGEGRLEPFLLAAVTSTA